MLLSDGAREKHDAKFLLLSILLEIARHFRNALKRFQKKWNFSRNKFFLSPRKISAVARKISAVQRFSGNVQRRIGIDTALVSVDNLWISGDQRWNSLRPQSRWLLSWKKILVITQYIVQRKKLTCIFYKISLRKMELNSCTNLRCRCNE